MVVHNRKIFLTLVIFKEKMVGMDMFIWNVFFWRQIQLGRDAQHF